MISVKDLCDRYGWFCHLCGQAIDPGLPPGHPMAASRDHLKTRHSGGSDHTRNLRPAHRKCNSSKGKNKHLAKVERVRAKLGVGRKARGKRVLRGLDGQRLV